MMKEIMEELAFRSVIGELSNKAKNAARRFSALAFWASEMLR